MSITARVHECCLGGVCRCDARERGNDTSQKRVASTDFNPGFHTFLWTGKPEQGAQTLKHTRKPMLAER